MGCKQITRPATLLESGSQAIGNDESDSLEQPVATALDCQVSSANSSLCKLEYDNGEELCDEASIVPSGSSTAVKTPKNTSI